MSNKYEIHVISNTHWDREWLYNFQETRLMLVEMLDGLLDILDNNQNYKSFVLDSQTVPLEDYLEIRPQNIERIKKHVRDGRLLIGPWYTDPESFSVNGESLARNLLMGHRVAKSFGKVMKVGYTPFGYGQNSQMPQLYRNFGIDTMLFYHGVSHDEVKNEFLFEGADGSQVLSSQMSSGARYNFYHNVYRLTVKGKGIKERTYNWQEGGVPFHPASLENARAHHSLLNPETQFDENALKESINNLFEEEQAVATTKYLTFMSGHDSSVADEVELKIIEAAKAYLNDVDIFHSSLPELMQKIKAEAKDLTILKGERRTPKLMNGRVHLYSDVLSSRIQMKIQNARAEYKLQRVAEPYSTISWLLGNEYPEMQLQAAWKTLLKCHAHDSLAGSGVDDIERDMLVRLQQVNNICDSLTRRSLENIQGQIDTSGVPNDAVIITVHNPSPYERSEVISVALDIPLDQVSQHYSLTKPDNIRSFPVQIVSRNQHHSVINQPGEATLMMASEQTVFHFEAADIPALGYASYELKQNANINGESLVCGKNAMENDYLHIQIQTDGTLTIKHKQTNQIYDGLHYFEDSGEAGHAWMHIEPAIDKIITSRGRPASIALIEDGFLQARYRIKYLLDIPTGLDENGGDKWQRLDGSGSSSKRNDQQTELSITSTLTLTKNSPYIQVKTVFDNPAANHRLRVMFPSHLSKAKTCHAETAFDVVEREIEFTPESPWYGGENATFPMQRFVDVSDQKSGLAVINNGLREYQVQDDKTRTIALTLLRAYEINLTTVSWRWESHPEMELSQCPGRQEFDYLIYPHKGDWVSGSVAQVAEQLSVPLIPIQTGKNKGDLPPEFSFMKIEPVELILSAVKQSEEKKDMVIRIYNPTEVQLACKINYFKLPKKVAFVTMEEKLVENIDIAENSLSFLIGKKQVMTLKMTKS